MFVSKALIHELQRLADREGDPDSDYFIKAQDYLDDWLTDIKIEQSRWDKTSAVVVAVLGATEQTLNRLEVSLIVEQDRWKIRNVRLL